MVAPWRRASHHRWPATAVALLVAGIAAAQAPAPTHCTDGEVVYFSCQVRGTTKVASLCGGAAGPATAQEPAAPPWLQYRFGPPRAPQLVVPADANGSLAKFTGHYRRAPGVALTAISFGNRAVTYTVERSSAEDAGTRFTGVRIAQTSPRNVFLLPCAGEPAAGAAFAALAARLDPGPR